MVHFKIGSPKQQQLCSLTSLIILINAFINLEYMEILGKAHTCEQISCNMHGSKVTQNAT